MTDETPKAIEVTQTHIHPDCCAIEISCDGHTIRLEAPTPEMLMRLYVLYGEKGCVIR